MTSERDLIRKVAQGIQEIQKGNLLSGGEILTDALRQPELTGTYRANAYVWLAEISDDVKFKIDCHERALEADPDNVDIQARLHELRSGFDDPSAPASLPQTPQRPTSLPEDIAPFDPSTVGIYGDTNVHNLVRHTVRIAGEHDGTGFFATRNGLIVTTRATVGDQDRVEVMVAGNQQYSGEVVRSFPFYDVALVQVTLSLPERITSANFKLETAGNIPIYIMESGQSPVGGIASMRDAESSYWIPTNLLKLQDSGGNPVLDNQSKLIGMMTRNTSANNEQFLCMLHINAVTACIKAYMQESKATNAKGTYCGNCGYISRYSPPNVYYCENCGGLLAGAENIQRYPHPENPSIYNETAAPCTNCGARVGYDANQLCLRCGQEQSRSTSYVQ